jgi:hypothetical protein
MKLAHLKTPTKDPKKEIIVTRSPPAFEDLKTVRRKSCECLDCGKVGSK